MTTQDEKYEQEALQRVAERGGLPTFTGLEEVKHHFEEIEIILDEYATDANTVARAFESATEVPFPVEYEHVAVQALVVREIRDMVTSLGQVADSLDLSIYGIDASRRSQVSRDAS